MRFRSRKGDQAGRLNRKQFSDRLNGATYNETPTKILSTSLFLYTSADKTFRATADAVGFPDGYFPTAILLTSEKTSLIKVFLRSLDERDGVVAYKEKNGELLIEIGMA